MIQLEWLLGVVITTWIIELLYRDVMAVNFPKPCSDLKPHYLIDLAIPSKLKLPPGVSVIYDVVSHVHAYQFAPGVSNMSLDLASIFTKCKIFPEEFSIFITLKYMHPHHDEEFILLINRRVVGDKNNNNNNNNNSSNQVYTSTLLLSITVRKNKLIFHYEKLRVIFRIGSVLSDGDWHTLGLSVTGKLAMLTLDCRQMRTRKLRRRFPALLNVTNTRAYIGSSHTGAHTLQALLKQLVFLPGADVTSRACRQLLVAEERITDNYIPVEPGYNNVPSSLPDHVMCTWTDVGNLAYDFRSEMLKVCINGIWNKVPLLPELPRRMDYLVLHQDIRTPGPSLDAEIFTIPGEGLFCVFANSKSDNKGSRSSSIYQWRKGKFRFYQSIVSDTAQSICHFNIGKQSFLAVANYGEKTGIATNSVIFKWNRKRRKFVEFQKFVTYNARDFEHFRVEGNHFLVVANYQQGPLYEIDSIVYKWNTTTRLFDYFQSLETIGAYDFTYFQVDGYHFLAVANAFDGLTTRVFSAIYFWQIDRLIRFQTMETTGATDWEYFTLDNQAYLVVANAFNYGPQNFQDKDTHVANSTVYRLNRIKKQFERFQIIPTYSAIDWEFFQVADDSYLVLSNAQDDPEEERRRSVVFRWQGMGQFVPVHKLVTSPSSDWESFEDNGDFYLVYANANGRISQVLKVKFV